MNIHSTSLARTAIGETSPLRITWEIVAACYHAPQVCGSCAPTAYVQDYPSPLRIPEDQKRTESYGYKCTNTQQAHPKGHPSRNALGGYRLQPKADWPWRKKKHLSELRKDFRPSALKSLLSPSGHLSPRGKGTAGRQQAAMQPDMHGPAAASGESNLVKAVSLSCLRLANAQTTWGDRNPSNCAQYSKYRKVRSAPSPPWKCLGWNPPGG